MKGEVIAFISAPGVGTSFLTKQMACKNMMPGFFEGEEGIFTPSILSVLNNENDSFERYDWLTGRTKIMLERAHRIAKSGIDCYVDGDVLLAEAWLVAEIGDKSPVFLKKWLDENKHLMAHKVVVLTASDEKIKENIKQRGRSSEQSEFIRERALRIGRACVDLEKKYKHVQILNRSDLEFADSDTLAFVDKFIQSIPSHLI